MCLTARLIGRTDAKAGLRDPAIPCGRVVQLVAWRKTCWGETALEAVSENAIWVHSLCGLRAADLTAVWLAGSYTAAGKSDRYRMLQRTIRTKATIMISTNVHSATQAGMCRWVTLSTDYFSACKKRISAMLTRCIHLWRKDLAANLCHRLFSLRGRERNAGNRNRREVSILLRW